jgi:hypothetical protein
LKAQISNFKAKIFAPRFICVYLCSSVALLSLVGCAGKPNAANIELRKKNQALQAQIVDLQSQRAGDVAKIQSLEEQRGTLPTLPQDRLDKLFTAHGLSLGRLTGASAGDDGTKVYVVPTDQSGEPLKAAGSFVVELFDLKEQANNRVGRWEFSVDQARQNWYGRALLYTYVLPCEWQQMPRHSDLTLKVTFRDELTQREFEIQKPITVQLPSPTESFSKP